METDRTEMDRVARAIAAPRRREILTLVRDSELSAGEIASHFDISRPAVSQHLTALREAGLLSERREGARRIYRAQPEALAGLRDFLNGFWTDRLFHRPRQDDSVDGSLLGHSRRPGRPLHRS